MAVSVGPDPVGVGLNKLSAAGSCVRSLQEHVLIAANLQLSPEGAARGRLDHRQPPRSFDRLRLVPGALDRLHASLPDAASAGAGAMMRTGRTPTTDRGQVLVLVADGAWRKSPGPVIHGWVPTDFFTTYAGPGNPFGVLVAVAIGVPLYSNAAGIMPLVEALYDKGLPMATLLPS